MDNENDDDKPSLYDDPEEQEKGLFRWMNAFVVLLAVAGFFGLAWYADKGGDANVDEKDVEIVKADTAPIKETPANPGGMQIPDQDKTVYNLINGDKTQKPVAERILPSPEEPVARGDTESWMSDKVKNKDSGDVSDQTGVAPQDTARDAKAQVPASTAPTPENAPKAEQFNPAKLRAQEATAQGKPAQEVKNQPARASDAPSAGAPAPAAANSLAPASPVRTAAPDTLPAVKTAAADAPAPKTAPAASAKPAPAASGKTAKDASDVDDKSDDDTSVGTGSPAAKPAVPAAKGVRAQLGAYKSQAEAKSRWDSISRKFSDDLQGKQYVIARADLGDKGVFYRLQVAPFKNASEAEEFCLSFVSAGQGCFSVNVK